MEYNYIDLTYLEGVADGDMDIIKELVKIFIDQLPEFRDGFEESYIGQDWMNIAGIAHKAKSSVVSMGMKDLGNTDLKNLELVAKQCKILELEQKEGRSTSEEDELQVLKRNLEDYPSKRVEWVIENANKKTIQDLILKFNDTCSSALEELNEVLNS